jgi:hypothetical protein
MEQRSCRPGKPVAARALAIIADCNRFGVVTSRPMPVRHLRFRGSRRRTSFVLLLALSPACCAPPQPPPKPAEPAVEVLPSPPPLPARPILRAAWSFQTGPDACIAFAKAGSASLQIAVRPEGLIRLAVALPGYAPDKPVAHFSGPAGHWLIMGTQVRHREAVFTLGRDETSLSRILMLLSGGTLNLEPPDDDLPILSLPESGAEGQEWFVCARGSVG